MLPTARCLALPAFATLLLLHGCSGSENQSSGSYYLIATNIKLPYWQSAQAGLNAAASQLHVKAEMIGPDTYQPREQHEVFQRLIQQNPSGILISVGDRRLMRSDIDNAIGRGIPVFTIDSDAEYSKRLLFIGTDNVKAGSLIGSTAAAALGGKGDLVVYTMPEQLNLVQRLKGLNDSLATQPKMKVARVIDIKGDPRVAFDATSELLSSGSKVDGFVCLEAIACPEVAEVLNRQKISGKLVVAMDADRRTLDGIKSGIISATVAQKPYTMAYTGLRMLADLNQSHPRLDQPFFDSPTSPIPTFVDTGVTLINRDNVEQYLSQVQ